MIEIREYDEAYANALSKIILSNLYTITVIDHGKAVVDRIARHFTEEKIKQNFPYRAKCYVALKDGKVIGTASLDNFRGNNVADRYMVCTVFVDMDYHKHGAGKKLMQMVEDYAKEIHAKELIILSSIYAVEFYRKLGYDYLDGIKQLNEEKEYTLIKYLCE